MANKQLTIGSEFALTHSIHRFEREYHFPNLYDAPEPSTKKKWSNTETYYLAHPGMRREGDVWSVLSSDPSQNEQEKMEKPMCYSDLSSFLMHAYGLLRFEILHTWALHRGVASARCLYPTDLYITIPPDSILQQGTGIYYYDPYQHALVRVRNGDWSEAILESCNLECESQPLFITGLSSNFGRTAFYYEDFAYRLVTQELGLVESNTILAGKSKNLKAHVCHYFQDPVVNEIFNLTGTEESMMSIVPFFEERVPKVRKSTSKLDVNDNIEIMLKKHPAAKVNSKSFLAPSWYPGLVKMNRSSFIDSFQSDSMIEPRYSMHENIVQRNEEYGIELSDSECNLPNIDISYAWRNRYSGSNVDLNPALGTISFEHFSTILKFAYPPLETMVANREMEDDSLAIQSEDYKALRIFCVVNHVEGLPAGVYEYDPIKYKLYIVKSQRVGIEFQKTYVQDNVNMLNISFCLFPVVHYPRIFEVYGNRGYRIINMLAGHLANRIDLVASSLGYGIRCSDSIQEEQTNKILNINLPEQPLMHIIGFKEQKKLSLGNYVM